MNDLEFMEQARQRKMIEKPWTEADYGKKCKELVIGKVAHGSEQQEREKIRLWMQIQNEARKLLDLADRKGITIRFTQEAR